MYDKMAFLPLYDFTEYANTIKNLVYFLYDFCLQYMFRFDLSLNFAKRSTI